MDFPTHRLGNTLDLVFTECSSNITINSCTKGPLWSDHFTVEMSFNIPKPLLKCQIMQYHKIISIDTNLFVKAIDTHSLLDIDDFEGLVSEFFGSFAVCTGYYDSTQNKGGDPVSSHVLPQ